MSVRRYPSISEPTTDTNSLRESVLSTKESLEILTRQRGDPAMSAVTWQDLVDLGFITPLKVPTKNT